MTNVSSWLSSLDKHEPGPSPGYSRAHALLAFITIASAGTIGRQALARNSGLGEGSIRTVLKRFRRDRYVTADTSGCHLTDSGKRLFQSISARLTSLLPLKASNLVVGRFQVAVLVRSATDSVGSGIDQRDSAVRLGADGATTYLIRSGKFAIPGGSVDCEKDFPDETWSTLRGELKPNNGDVVILCGARDEGTAKLGALAASLTLI